MDTEELIDYEDENDAPTTGHATATGAGVGAAPAAAAAADGDKEKKNYAGIHSTGFRSVFSFNILVCHS